MAAQKITIKMGEDELKQDVVGIIKKASPNFVSEQTEQLNNIFLQVISDRAINFATTESHTISKGKLLPCR